LVIHRICYLCSYLETYTHIMKRIFTLLFVFTVGLSYSQDVHYSQFYNSPLIVNPANTGIFNGDKRITLSYKDQESSVPVPWRTFTGAYDMKFYPSNSDDHFFSGGVSVTQDRQGSSRLQTFNLNFLGAYTRILNSNNLFTVGVALGYANSASFFENALGVNYTWQKSNRTNLNIGASVFHLIEPEVSFFSGSTVPLARRFGINGIGNFQVAEDLDIQVHGIAQYQDGPSEYIIGALGKFYLDSTPGSEWQLHAGLGYRTKQALFPTVAIQHRNLYLSASYDIGLSEFNELHSGGGIELHFRYIWADPPSPKKVKVCPIF